MTIATTYWTRKWRGLQSRTGSPSESHRGYRIPAVIHRQDHARARVEELLARSVDKTSTVVLAKLNGSELARLSLEYSGHAEPIQPTIVHGFACQKGICGAQSRKSCVSYRALSDQSRCPELASRHCSSDRVKPKVA